MRTVVSSVVGASNCTFAQHVMENASTLAGRTATLTFWAKADAAKNMAIEFIQVFGSGGAPPPIVYGIAPQLVALTTAWKKFSVAVAVPSIAGKVIGTDNNDTLIARLWFDAGSTYAARTASLIQQSGTFDIAHVSLVEGDATAEADPFSPRHIQQELDLCQRYYRTIGISIRAYATAASYTYTVAINISNMRITPTASIRFLGSSNQIVSSALNVNSPSFSRFDMVSSSAGDIYVIDRIYGLDAEL